MFYCEIHMIQYILRPFHHPIFELNSHIEIHDVNLFESELCQYCRCQQIYRRHLINGVKHHFRLCSFEI